MDNNEQKDTVINTKKGKVTINDKAMKLAIRSFYERRKPHYSLTKEEKFKKRIWKNKHKNIKK